MSWLNNPLCALDTETTSADPEEARVITGCLGISERPGIWYPEEWYINPGVPVGDSEKIHGFSDQDVQQFGEPVGAVGALRERLATLASERVPIVGHNLTYDLTVLDREFRRHLGQSLPEGLLCLDTLVLFRRFDFTTGGKRLEDLAFRNGITFPAHDATADALAALRLLHILAADNDLLPLVPVADLQPLQAKWHAAHQEAAAAKRRGNGQSANDFNTDWPIRALAAQPLRAEPERTP